MFELHDIVRIRESSPEHGPSGGITGNVVNVLLGDDAAYEADVVDEGGSGLLLDALPRVLGPVRVVRSGTLQPAHRHEGGRRES